MTQSDADIDNMLSQYDKDIGNMVGNILAGGPTSPIPLSKEDQLRESIVVPDDFVASLVRPEPPKPLPTRLKAAVKQEELINEEVIATKTAKELVVEFKGLIFQAKALIKEMTTCGMLGVNMGAPTSDPMKPKKKVVKKKNKVIKKTIAESTDDICAQIIAEMKT